MADFSANRAYMSYMFILTPQTVECSGTLLGMHTTASREGLLLGGTVGTDKHNVVLPRPSHSMRPVTSKDCRHSSRWYEWRVSLRRCPMGPPTAFAAILCGHLMDNLNNLC